MLTDQNIEIKEYKVTMLKDDCPEVKLSAVEVKSKKGKGF